MNVPLFPPAAAMGAAWVDTLYWVLVGLTVVILMIVFLPMTYFLWRFRRGHRADRTAILLPCHKLEIAWTVLPLLIALGLFAGGAQIYLKLETPPDQTLVINAIGKQWMWKIQHAEGPRELNELHVPAGQPVKLVLASEDVIHSFFIPAFRIKQDVVPGRFTTLWFHPNRIGAYHLFCAEFCGAGHSRMIGAVHVLSPADFALWLRQGNPTPTLAQRGERLYRELGCSGCHSGSTVVRAPQLEGLYGRPVPLQDQTVTIANDQYLRDSILLPALQVTAGYEPLMPTYQGHIGEEDLVSLIAYLKSLANRPSEEFHER